MKQYVEVLAKFDLAGQIIPLYIKLHDKRYQIDKVKFIRQAASLKAGGMGLRYTCLIARQEFYLFLEDNKWFIDKP